ncbi:MAG: enoyl-CoA hydratase [Hyphomicrobiaceae bacterium]
MSSSTTHHKTNSDSAELLVARNGGVLTLTFNRPKQRNALTANMLDILARELAKAELDSRIGCVVLTGAGNSFCAGGDVKAMTHSHESGHPVDHVVRMERQRSSHRATSVRLYEMSKPTIAALPGAAAGAGFSLALACDLRIASEDAVMTTAFAKVGLSGDYGGTYFLTQLVGTAKARELYLISDKIDMATAQRLGIVNWVVPKAQLVAETLKLSQRLAQGPSVALRLIKDNLNRALKSTLAECLDMESANLAEARRTDDHIEAVAAFAQRRAPVFKGR